MNLSRCEVAGFNAGIWLNLDFYMFLPDFHFLLLTMLPRLTWNSMSYKAGLKVLIPLLSPRAEIAGAHHLAWLLLTFFSALASVDVLWDFSVQRS